MADYHGRRRVGWKELWHFDAFPFCLALFGLKVRELRSLALGVSVDVSCRYRYIVNLAVAEKKKAEL